MAQPPAGPTGKPPVENPGTIAGPHNPGFGTQPTPEQRQDIEGRWSEQVRKLDALTADLEGIMANFQAFLEKHQETIAWIRGTGVFAAPRKD